jgi:DNA polymerase-4
MDRVILHVDMDAFYVSVELRRHPELVGLPVVVGGAGPRGVVAAASYEARRYGVHSALPSSTARQRCPHAVFLRADHQLYASVSAEVHAIFHDVTPLVEPLALDEAFLDVTGSGRLLGDGVTIAGLIRRRTSAELHLPCSVGVAPSKFLAKLASEAAKPRATPQGVRPGRGIVEVRPGGELDFLHPLPVGALWGVGPATLKRLERLGVRTVGELAALDERLVIANLGEAHGRHLHRLAWALDDRPVEPDREAKSIGHEETYPTDRVTRDEVDAELVRLADGVAGRLRSHGLAARTVTIKVRFGDFRTITRSATLKVPTDTAHELARVARDLATEIDPTPGIRLLGVSTSNFGEVAEQLSLDALVTEPTQGWSAAERTVDRIRQRFGTGVIGPASAVRHQPPG